MKKKLCVATLALTALAFGLAAPAVAQPVQVGEYISESFESPHPYKAGASEQAQLVWFDEIYFPGATYIAPHFERMDLAAGDQLIVRSPDNSRVWTYEGTGKGELGINGEGFWGIHIHGERAILELWSTSAEPKFGYKIDQYARGFTDTEGPNRSLCGADDSLEAKCYETSEPDAYNESRAVVRLLINGGSLCTGWLLGDEGHMMTNEHCITSQAAAGNTNYELMAEGAACATNCQSSLGCPGTVVTTSGTLVQDSVPLDYALIALSVNPTPTYGYLQLRETGAVLGERIYHPQHPAGWGKRIVVASSYPTHTTGFAVVDSLTEDPCDFSSTVDEVGYFSDTRGGSSGSPVLGYADNMVIALHHCRGSAFCTSGNPATDDPNRGVPVDAIIADLGGNLPNNAIGSNDNIFVDGFESGDFSAWTATN